MSSFIGIKYKKKILYSHYITFKHKEQVIQVFFAQISLWLKLLFDSFETVYALF